MLNKLGFTPRLVTVPVKNIACSLCFTQRTWNGISWEDPREYLGALKVNILRQLWSVGAHEVDNPCYSTKWIKLCRGPCPLPQLSKTWSIEFCKQDNCRLLIMKCCTSLSFHNYKVWCLYTNWILKRLTFMGVYSDLFKRPSPKKSTKMAKGGMVPRPMVPTMTTCGHELIRKNKFPAHELPMD